MKIFISYSKKNRPIVEALAGSLDVLGHGVWYDPELERQGGHPWWKLILKEIRGCEVFVFAMTDDSLKSRACQAEHRYALDLNKLVLPVTLSDDLAMNKLPLTLQSLQILAYTDKSNRQLKALRDTLNGFIPNPLPSALPPEPEPPFPPLVIINNHLQTQNIDPDLQWRLVGDLEKAIIDGEDPVEVTRLLDVFQGHRYITQVVAKRLIRLRTEYADYFGSSPSVPVPVQIPTPVPSSPAKRGLDIEGFDLDDFNLQDVRESPIRKIERLSGEARSARNNADYEQVVTACVEAVRLYQENQEAFTPSEVADFGNLALYAETVATKAEHPRVQKLASLLFHIGMDLNPRHANNLLNYVSFILDAEHPAMTADQRAECQTILGEGDTPGNLFNQDRALYRWLSYKARLAIQADQPWESYAQRMVDQFQIAPIQSSFSEIMSLFQHSDGNVDFSLMHQTMRIYAARVNGQELNWALLMYADSLKGQDNVNVRLQVYDFVVRPEDAGGIQNTVQKMYRANALHNFAADLFIADYNIEAGRRWYASYMDMGTDLARSGNLNYGYSRYLDSYRQQELGRLVRDGKPITEMYLPTDGKQTPPELPDYPGVHEYFPGGIDALGLF